jgi:hypothetical protein
MFYEYAVDPSAISSWQLARYFLDAFGPWKGRFLAELPHRKWKACVVNSLNCGDIEKARIVEKLTRIDSRIFSARIVTTYNEEKTWTENALAEHRKLPLRAIVSAHYDGENVVNPDSVDEDHELWRVDSGMTIARLEADLVARLRPLLHASNEVILIDPHFQADKQGIERIIYDLSIELAQRKSGFIICTSERTRHYDLCMRSVNYSLPVHLAVGSEVTVRCLKERRGGQRLHNRYILTNVGGVQFGDSIESGHDGQSDRVSILDSESHRILWQQYAGDSPAFDKAGPCKIVKAAPSEDPRRRRPRR